MAKDLSNFRGSLSDNQNKHQFLRSKKEPDFDFSGTRSRQSEISNGIRQAIASLYIMISDVFENAKIFFWPHQNFKIFFQMNALQINHQDSKTLSFDKLHRLLNTAHFIFLSSKVRFFLNFYRTLEATRFFVQNIKWRGKWEIDDFLTQKLYEVKFVADFWPCKYWPSLSRISD